MSELMDDGMLATPAPTRARKPWAAALFSFVLPGLGQLYAGRSKRAAIAFGMTWSAALLFFAMVHFAPGRLAVASLPVLLGVALGVIVDAYRCANRAASPYALARYNRWYVYLAAIAINALVLSPIRVSNAIFGATRPWSIPSTSMAPTLVVGDYLWATALPDGPIARGSLAIFQSPSIRAQVIKRVAGIPGDTVGMRDGVLYLNGKAFLEEYLDAPGDCAGAAPDSARRNWGPLVVAPYTYFMLGDNRDCAVDSRAYGAVRRDSIYQRPALIYFSHDSAGIQWDRIGMVPK